MFHVPNKYRLRYGIMGSGDFYGNNGAFMIQLSGQTLASVIASDGEGWEHVSIHMTNTRTGDDRTPTWAEMCKIKDLFWDEEDCVIQFHPPKSEYVNNHKHTLHLWRPANFEIQMPHSLLVGFKPHSNVQNRESNS